MKECQDRDGKELKQAGALWSTGPLSLTAGKGCKGCSFQLHKLQGYTSKVSIQVKASHPCDIQETWHTDIFVDVDSLFSLIFYGIRVAGREEIFFKHFGF